MLVTFVIFVIFVTVATKINLDFITKFLQFVSAKLKAFGN